MESIKKSKNYQEENSSLDFYATNSVKKLSV